ncbi:integrase [Mycobacterium sp. IS-3022]|nr:site-specific integrase [Mycobacterium sp. IS-3022]KUH93927.1 integrase [Mycobacterium sp. IS-3022]
MASIRKRPRRDGSITYAVLFTIDARQTSVPFADESDAEKFRALVNSVGGKRAMAAWGIGDTPRSVKTGPTLAEYLTRHIDHLTGCERKTIAEYRRYAAQIGETAIAPMPLASLTRADIARWINTLTGSGKTISNKHGFLSSALNSAVREGLLAANPCANQRLPRTPRKEMVCLDRSEFQSLVAAFSQHYQPLVTFLVASGARFSEVTALIPADVDRAAGTVRISRSWKRTPGGYELGAPKTPKSIRTINVPRAVLDQLDYSHKWLFTTTGGGPVRLYSWRANVWNKALPKAKLKTRPRIHDLRHTCASWMIQAGVPLPVVQAHLGHESIKTTVDLYGHVDRKSAEAAADAIAAALAFE